MIYKRKNLAVESLVMATAVEVTGMASVTVCQFGEVRSVVVCRM